MSLKSYNFSLPVDPETIEKVEKLVVEKKYKEALNHTLFEE